MKADELAFIRADELIAQAPEMTLLSIVMKLTGGQANPATVLAQIAAHRSEKSTPVAPVTSPLVAVSRGCACPPGAEATCRGMLCPRRPVTISSARAAMEAGDG